MATYPGNYAVPGAFWPGAAWPGNSVNAASVTGLALFTGSEPLIYPQYEDLTILETLVALPWNTYDVQVFGGNNPGLPALPGDGRWYAIPSGGGEDFLVFSEIREPGPGRHYRWFRLSRAGAGPLHGCRVGAPLPVQGPVAQPQPVSAAAPADDGSSRIPAPPGSYAAPEDAPVTAAATGGWHRPNRTGGGPLHGYRAFQR